MPECQKIKNGGLDQYGPERLGKLIFATIRKSVVLKRTKAVVVYGTGTLHTGVHEAFIDTAAADDTQHAAE